jgi:hypothetical protein
MDNNYKSNNNNINEIENLNNVKKIVRSQSSKHIRKDKYSWKFPQFIIHNSIKPILSRPRYNNDVLS